MRKSNPVTKSPGINEEMDTAREELQSANEDVTMLNEELKNRNLELVRINDDLVNIQNSVGIPMIILTNDLKIRRMTPAAAKFLNISPTDLGRPIGDISLFVDSPDLKELAAEVIQSATPIEREVRARSGRRWSLMIICLLYTSDAADDLLCVDLGGRRIIKKKKKKNKIRRK